MAKDSLKTAWRLLARKNGSRSVSPIQAETCADSRWVPTGHLRCLELSRDIGERGPGVPADLDRYFMTVIDTHQELTMNKFAKGSLAAGAGIVLLLGGAGTLAYWSSDIELTGGKINAGTLQLTADTTEFAQAGPVALVPGDVRTFTAELTLLAEGDNIEGTVALNEQTVTFLNADGVADPSLAPKFDIDVDLTEVAAEGISANGETLVFTQAGTYTIDAEVTVSLPYGTAVDNTTQGATVDLENVSFVATQTPAQGSVGTE